MSRPCCCRGLPPWAGPRPHPLLSSRAGFRCISVLLPGTDPPRAPGLPTFTGHTSPPRDAFPGHGHPPLTLHTPPPFFCSVAPVVWSTVFRLLSYSLTLAPTAHRSPGEQGLCPSHPPLPPTPTTCQPHLRRSKICPKTEGTSPVTTEPPRVRFWCLFRVHSRVGTDTCTEHGWYLLPPRGSVSSWGK